MSSKKFSLRYRFENKRRQLVADKSHDSKKVCGPSQEVAGSACLVAH